MKLAVRHPHSDEFAEAAAQAFAAPKRPVENEFHSAYPGVSRDVLRGLRPFDARAHLRSVPLVSIDDNIAAIRALHAAHPGAGNALLDRPGALDALAEIRQLLAEVAV